MTGSNSKHSRRDVHGVVLVDKPEGRTSNDVLQAVKRLYHAKKGGHTGALDPFATGLLPICLGEATKFSSFLLEAKKAYIATLTLGQATNSGDKLGEVTQTQAVPALTTEKVVGVLNQFLGTTLQTPPMYSALKYQGRPLYAYAREGIEVERTPREITLDAITLKQCTDHQLVFEVVCSKGTYIRTLGEDIAQRLGTVGHLTALHRTQSGDLKGTQMASIEAIAKAPEAHLRPLDTAIVHLPVLHLNETQAHSIMHGGKLALDTETPPLVRLYDDQQFLGIGEWQTEKACLKPKRLIHPVFLKPAASV